MLSSSYIMAEGESIFYCLKAFQSAYRKSDLKVFILFLREGGIYLLDSRLF
jgi:hypothetical protein